MFAGIKQLESFKKKTDMKKDEIFVMRHYRNDALDTKHAYRRFAEATGLRVRATRLRLWFSAAAAAIVLAVAGALVWMQQGGGQTIYESGDTPLALVLPDGSEVTLQPHSSLAFRGDSCRRLYLHGAASFSVRHDASRPFTASGTIGSVKVLGTRFSLDERGGKALVSVESGRVKFASVKTGGNVVMTRGMKAVLASADSKPTVTQQPAQALLHTFAFSATPLGEVLSALGAYYDVRLTTAQDNLTRRLTGRFTATQLEDIVPVIEQTLDVKIKVEEP